VSIPFDAGKGLIIIPTEVEGPSKNVVLRLALDTGATGTLINAALLVSIGYDPALSPERVQITTGSGVEYVPRVLTQKVSALGQDRTGFPVLCHTLPPTSRIDGLLGLDFFRGQVLTIDFQQGEIRLNR
jgi:predicted aspartyl protease